MGGHKGGGTGGVGGDAGPSEAKGIGHPASHEGEPVARHCVCPHFCATLCQEVGILQPDAAQEESCSISMLAQLGQTSPSILVG